VKPGIFDRVRTSVRKRELIVVLKCMGTTQSISCTGHMKITHISAGTAFWIYIFWEFFAHLREYYTPFKSVTPFLTTCISLLLLVIFALLSLRFSYSDLLRLSINSQTTNCIRVCGGHTHPWKQEQPVRDSFSTIYIYRRFRIHIKECF
jgi:hypothetical protein